MNIEYGIFDEKGFTKHPTISFDQQFIALEDLLNIDHSLITLDAILSKIDLIESHKSTLQRIGSERSLAEISLEKVTIYDTFEDFVNEEDVYPTVELTLAQFKEIVLNWKKKREELLNTINSIKNEK